MGPGKQKNGFKSGKECRKVFQTFLRSGAQINQEKRSCLLRNDCSNLEKVLFIKFKKEEREANKDTLLVDSISRSCSKFSITSLAQYLANHLVENDWRRMDGRMGKTVR